MRASRRTLAQLSLGMPSMGRDSASLDCVVPRFDSSPIPRKRARIARGPAECVTLPAVLHPAAHDPSLKLASSSFSHSKSRSSATSSSRSGSAVSRNKHWVFVYGTSKRGFPSSGLLSGATFLGEFRTVVAYPLVVGGAYFSPYLLDLPGKGSRVKGEVYAVSDAMLQTLDRYENVGTSYARKVIKVSSCTDRSFVANAFVYLKCNYSNDLLVQRYLSEYQPSSVQSRRSRISRPASSMAANAGSSMYNGRYCR